MAGVRGVSLHELPRAPLFTNNDFAQIGCGAPIDRRSSSRAIRRTPAGMVPSLRSVGLRASCTRASSRISARPSASQDRARSPERDAIPGAGLYTFNMSGVDKTDIRGFENRWRIRVRDEISVRPPRAAERARRDGGNALASVTKR
jgi:hypothetical protein